MMKMKKYLKRKDFSQNSSKQRSLFEMRESEQVVIVFIEIVLVEIVLTEIEKSNTVS
jgi:hypothetical protein